VIIHIQSHFYQDTLSSITIALYSLQLFRYSCLHFVIFYTFILGIFHIYTRSDATMSHSEKQTCKVEARFIKRLNSENKNLQMTYNIA